MQKLERLASSKGARLYLPPRLARLIPPESRFQPVLTEEGVLFKLIKQAQEIEDYPSWIIVEL